MKNTQLQLVREQELQKKHSLSQKLAVAASLAHGEQQQLKQLKQYQNDYLSMINTEQVDWPAAKSKHYRDFCYQLNGVVETQKAKFEQTKATIQEYKKAIEQQQHKIEVIDKLIEKALSESLAADNKRFQQESDALVARRYFH